jgi:tetratricopeptide (TPR) repeat protein
VRLTQEPNNVLALVTQADLLSYEMDYLSPEGAKKLKAESMSLSKRALALAPNDSEVWMSYASSLEMANDDGTALEAANRAVELDPFNPYAAVYRARLLMRHGRLDMAVRQAREAPEIVPQMQDLAGSAAFVECQSTYY